MRRTYIAAAAMAVLAILLYTGFNRLGDDSAPVIEYPEASPVWQEGADPAQLLSDVRATDAQDGDVTRSLVIESVTTLSEGAHYIVVYAARDSKNNIVKKSRVVYTGTEAQTAKEESPEANPEKSTNEAGMPKITLKTGTVSISRGSAFNAMNYIESAEDDKDDAWKYIHIAGQYSPDTAGEYILTYYILDSDGNRSNEEKLSLTVK